MSDQNEALLKIASAVKLFYGMPRTLLIKALSCSDRISVKKGDLFFNEGDAGESFYVLIIGQVVVERTNEGKWIQLATLKPGDSFGEMTLIDEKIRSARVKASADCTALFLPLQRIKQYPDLTSSLYLNIAKVLAKRLRTASSSLADMTAKVMTYEGIEDGKDKEEGKPGDGEKAEKEASSPAEGPTETPPDTTAA
jgi:CRP-like cAMP-binding protein